MPPDTFPVSIADQQRLLKRLGDELREFRGHVLGVVTESTVLLAAFRILEGRGVYLPEIAEQIFESLNAVKAALERASQLSLLARVRYEGSVDRRLAAHAALVSALWGARVRGVTPTHRLRTYQWKHLREEGALVVQGFPQGEQLGPQQFRFTTPLEIRTLDGETLLEHAWTVSVHGDEVHLEPANDEAHGFLRATDEDQKREVGGEREFG